MKEANVKVGIEPRADGTMVVLKWNGTTLLMDPHRAAEIAHALLRNASAAMTSHFRSAPHALTLAIRTSLDASNELSKPTWAARRGEKEPER